MNRNGSSSSKTTETTGLSSSISCTACGKQNRQQARFCGHCGQPLQSSKSRLSKDGSVGQKRNDIDMVYQACLAPSTLARVSASKVAAYVESPFKVYCEEFAPEEERDPDTCYQEQLLAQGRVHEGAIVETTYPEAQEEAYLNMEDGFRKTLAMMAEGAAAIHDMPLIFRPQGMHGRPDLLLRKEGQRSRWGNYSYEAIEIKYTQHPCQSHKVQGVFYSRLLGFVQGVMPEEFHIESGTGYRFSFAHRDYEAALDDTIAGVRRILAGEVVEPCYGSCPWPWEGYGNRLAIENRDVSLIAGVGPKVRAVLKAAGFRTIDEVASATPKILMQIKGIGSAKAYDFHLKAKAIQSNRPIWRVADTITFPQRRYELFLDLEGTDRRFEAEGLPVTNYLIGMIVHDHRAAVYRPFFAHTEKEEKRILQEFCKYLVSLDDYVIYHWHHYERDHLTKMLDEYRFPATAKARVLDHLVDLRALAIKAVAFPVYSEGLKPIAQSLGFQWRQDDVDALTSIVLYRDFVESHGQKKDAAKKILIYNEDDCQALMCVKNWLAGSR